ncbi:beta-1,6-N-acetylglucosaminyltransferase [Escherichia coli]|uniref:beta-1,6-N-acetylglucosaminyltransferase n=1 Tax=Escherichia coli TaxID=562 RepID=UPI00200F8DE2|nr:beta-1,6-N-acetylglucosaminyltransferase [Escherichia coli]
MTKNYSTVVMILAHRNINYILQLAEANPDVYFIIHYDKKIDLKFDQMELGKLANLHIIEDRIAVFWAGFSQTKATLKLIDVALNNTSAKYFHLMSAECFPLISFGAMEKEWAKNPDANYIESHIRDDNAWRVKTWMPHADSIHMRTFWGRVLKRILRIGSKFINTSGISSQPYYGSQWFSISRTLAEKIVEIDKTTNYFNKFSRITCSDEHAFAMFVRDFNIQNVMDYNKRYIKFPKGGSNPLYLDLNETVELNTSLNSKFWFARKFEEESMLNYIKINHHD